MLGEVDVVVLLRDPVRRAVSHWRFSTDHGLETRPLDEALLADLEERERPWDPATSSVSPFTYVRRGRYADQLGPWTSTFPDTVRVLFLEELLADPGALPRLVADLGLDPGRTPSPATRPVNASGGDPPVLSASVRGTLQEGFRESNERLADMLGRSLPW
jgi:hypothetical protein